jgi:CheY-like chemotaxis protein
MHGGTIEARSEGPGRGSEFVIRLPALPRTSAPLSVGESPVGVIPVNPLRVLLVDDNVDAAETLALVLRLAGHEVRTVHEASAVVGAVDTFHPDAVVLDIGLPGGLTGYDLARQLRGQPGASELRLVALTGFGQEEDKRRAREAGFDAHVTKPADLDELQAALVPSGPVAV